MHRFTIALCGIALAGSAHAVDGVFEINASCAQFGKQFRGRFQIVGNVPGAVQPDFDLGCFSGDGPGLPVQIENPGSYRLTSNLTTTSVNQTLIDVNVNTVSIDLNGFSLQGPVTCSGFTLTCSASGTGDGIDANTAENVTIRNGAIIGMGDDGVRVGIGAYIEELIVAENAGAGIEALSSGSVLRRLSVRENGGNGVSLGLGSSYIMDSTVYNNGNQGVFGGFCGNVLMSVNDGPDSCVAIAPNRCDVATDCD